ncbi:MAG: hypothetical protein IKQ96_07210 [Lachnospiraceae bacterium]|nr:hypothetical protein [Lachnospiraceae bacterium]
MRKKEVYGVFFDIRKVAYVCSAPCEADLKGACYITHDEADARKQAKQLNSKKSASTTAIA